MNSEAVEQMYRRNPILRYTQHPLHSPLLPLPYGEINNSRTSCLHVEMSSVCLYEFIDMT